MQEVKRPAKVGEYIKLLCSEEDCCKGDICKVIAQCVPNGRYCYIRTKRNSCDIGNNADRVIHQPFSLIADKYVVLENYKPQKNEKHKWAGEEIKETKNFVLDTIRDEAEKGNYFIFRRFKNKQKGLEAILICKNKTLLPTFGREADKMVGIENYKSATSKCSSNDEPNEWIGKCVAVCRLLNKPIPKFIMGD